MEVGFAETGGEVGEGKEGRIPAVYEHVVIYLQGQHLHGVLYLVDSRSRAVSVTRCIPLSIGGVFKIGSGGKFGKFCGRGESEG